MAFLISRGRCWGWDVESRIDESASPSFSCSTSSCVHSSSPHHSTEWVGGWRIWWGLYSLLFPTPTLCLKYDHARYGNSQSTPGLNFNVLGITLIFLRTFPTFIRMWENRWKLFFMHGSFLTVWALLCFHTCLLSDKWKKNIHEQICVCVLRFLLNLPKVSIIMPHFIKLAIEKCFASM